MHDPAPTPPARPASEPLKPCPFCAGSPIADRTLRQGYENDQTDPDAWAYFIWCHSCGAQGGWSKSLAGAFRLWWLRACEKKPTTLENVIRSPRFYALLRNPARMPGRTGWIVLGRNGDEVEQFDGDAIDDPINAAALRFVALDEGDRLARSESVSSFIGLTGPSSPT